MFVRKLLIVLFIVPLLLATIKEKRQSAGVISEKELAVGAQPQIAVDSKGTIHIAYGLKNGNDRLLYYIFSKDSGKSFSEPSLLGKFPQMGLGMGRGPQITTTKDFVTVTVGDHHGNLYALRSSGGPGSWSAPVKINDKDSTAKEALSEICAGSGNLVYTAWLDTRLGNNNLFGAISKDGGATWGKNQLIYKGEQKGVCDCCKPSVFIDKTEVLHIMFRNKLDGARNMYIVQSKDYGQHFSTAKKLGSTDFMIDGCPMDGGDISADGSGIVTTVWRRQTEVFEAKPGKQEVKIGTGNTPTVVETRHGPLIVWHQNGEILYRGSHGREGRLAKGQFPKLAASSVQDKIFCVYEQNDKIVFTTFQ
ncbi:hypothetical protein GCM10007423_22930 [Dyadobacter endophyticus]|uniref:Sialidase domain-containing protein n=1 Tax=Dyadobacter endophyticus TaxID=1749036 RepID=A0ABQ1YNS1_9BACT|nr:exo-alpha-sialidase [Dyadobacter endophyticus]GGH32998.1 hypothetical protein GCM10007423_22930 [Dyadobacter endophyticus]